MIALVLGVLIFVATHLVPARPDWRAALVARLGLAGYRAGFALVALAAIALIVFGYGAARSAGAHVVYDPPAWTRHLVATLLLPVFPLAFAALLPGRIRASVKHPLLAAVKLWAAAHLVANGTLPDLVLFGGLLAWAVVDQISLKRRGVAVPAPVAGWTRNDTIAVAGGLVVYAAFVARLHLWLIGVSPV